MSNALPEALGRLLDPKDIPVRDAYWAEFVGTYSRLILHVARSIGGPHDAVMDRYAFVLEQFRRDECRRLRGYVADGRSEFSTWLVVVTQRLCRDYERQRYGRVRTHSAHSTKVDDARAARRRLIDLVGAEVDLSTLADPHADEPDASLRMNDLRSALASAVSQLEARDRLLITLKFEDDLPMPEIAANLGYPTRFHAYRRLKEVLASLRCALAQRGVRESTP